MMEERTFFEYEDVKVTNSSFVSNGQTYAMSNVTSAKRSEEKPSRVAGIVLGLFGLALTSLNGFLGILIVAVATYYLYQQKTVFHVVLATSAGETRALVTYQRNYLNKVVIALNNAIVYRG